MAVLNKSVTYQTLFHKRNAMMNIGLDNTSNIQRFLCVHIKNDGQVSTIHAVSLRSVFYSESAEFNFDDKAMPFALHATVPRLALILCSCTITV